MIGFGVFEDFVGVIDALEENGERGSFDRMAKKAGVLEKEARKKAEMYDKKHVVFISVPMAGRDEATIEREIAVAEREYLRMRGWKANEVKFVNNLHCPKAPETLDVDQAAAWYLGEAIKKMAQCDEALFIGKWQQARGCIMEKQVCALYGIPVRTMNGCHYEMNWRRG